MSRISVFLVVCFTLSVAAGTNVWTTVGPDGGRVISLAIDPQSPATLFAAFGFDGGVWKTIDGGGHWQRVATGLGLQGYSFVAVHPTQSTVFATQQTGPLYRSTNGGVSWSPTTLTLSSSSTPQFGFAPGDANTIYYGIGAVVYKSTDAGQSWQPSTVATSDTNRGLVATPSFIVTALAAKGIYRSTDGGTIWTPSNGGLPSTSVRAFASDPDSPNVLFVIASDFKIYTSTDTGGTWTVVAPTTHSELSALWIQPGTHAIWALARSSGVTTLSRSTDGGVTFSSATTGHRNAGAVAFHPTTANTVYAMLDEGIYKTTDGASSWSSAHGSLRAHYATMSFSPSSAGTWWAGLYSCLAKTIDGGQNFNIIYPQNTVPVGEALAIHPTNSDIVVTGSYPPDADTCSQCPNTGIVRTTNGGTNWTAAANPDFPSLVSALQVFSILFDPTSPDRLFLGSGSGSSTSKRIWTSTDAGSSVTGAATGFPSTTRALNLALSHPTPGTTTLFAAAAAFGPGFGLYRSVDLGTSWHLMAGGLPASHQARSIAIDATSTSTVYAGVSGGTVPIYRSIDGGDTWAPFGTGLPLTTINAIAIDPVAPTIMYAGAFGQEGIYRSTDGGAQWSPFNAGMINKSILRIAIDPHDHNHLVAATQGGGLWEITLDSATAPPPTPSNLVASASSATSVGLSWTASAGADHYEIIRAGTIDGYVSIGTAGSNAYTDGTVTAGHAYVYKVRAIDASSHASSYSVPDVATTIVFTDSPIVAGATLIKEQHIVELRQAVDAVRATASLVPMTPGDATLTGLNAKASHVQELRSSLSSALSSLSVPIPSYSDATLTAGTTLIKAAHLMELRNAVN